MNTDSLQARGRRAVVVAICFFFVMTTAAAGASPQRGDYPWESMQDHEFAVADGGTLKVDVAGADIIVVPSTGDHAEVVISLRSDDMGWAGGIFEAMNYRARLDGNTVIVEGDRRPRNSWRSNNWLSVRAEIRVPARFNLDIATDDGDVSVGSFRGDAVVRSDDGDLSFASLDGDRIVVHTEDGDISASRFAAGVIEVVTADGDINIDAVTGEISARTQDGDIRIASTNSPRLLLDTSDGDIHIGIANDSHVDASTNDGDIAIVAPQTLRADIDLSGEDVSILGGFNINGRISSGSAEGRINGGGQEINAHTNDGSVTLVARNSN